MIRVRTRSTCPGDPVISGVGYAAGYRLYPFGGLRPARSFGLPPAFGNGIGEGEANRVSSLRNDGQFFFRWFLEERYDTRHGGGRVCEKFLPPDEDPCRSD